MTTAPFSTADEVKAHITSCPPEAVSIRPHHSASYIWEVRCAGAFGRFTYGFSSEESLIAWANSYFSSDS